MKTFVFKRNEVTSMKVLGVLDADNMIIDTEDGSKNITTLLSAFNGAVVELNVKTKNEEDLSEPTSDSDESEEYDY